MGNEQFVIYPHPANSEPQPDLDPKDKLVYVAIRRYMNKSTLEAFPSYATITKDTGAAAKTIKKCVDNLIREGYIETRREGRSLIYKFNNKRCFEPYSYDFLDKPDLSFTEKSYIIATHQYMFKDGESGAISISNKELSSLIKMSESQISKCNHSLEAKGYMCDAGRMTKRFDLRELDQLFIWKFKEQDERICKNEDDIEMLKKAFAELKIENEHNKALLRAKNIEPDKFIV